MMSIQDHFPTCIGRYGTRPILAVVAILLAVALRGPLWFTRMESPQYRGEEALKLVVYAGQMRGDLREIQTLNQYIGVTLPERIPELRWALWGLSFLLVLVLVALALPMAARRKAAIAIFTLMLAAMIGGFHMLEERLEEFGHHRGHSIVARVPDFSPPLLGTAKIANFTVHAGLEYGSWAFLAAWLLTGMAAFAGRKTSLHHQEAGAQDCHVELVHHR